MIKLLIFVCLCTLTIGHRAEATEAAPINRTYKTAQGVIDIDKLEAILAADLGNTQVRVTEVRWPFNPIHYNNYVVSSLISVAKSDPAVQVATYIVQLKINGQHDASCKLQLRPKIGGGTVWDCESDTAEILMMSNFWFEQVGIPFARKAVIRR